MLSTGTTSTTATGTATATLFAGTNLSAVQTLHTVRVHNDGTSHGFVSIDAGTTWLRLSAASVKIINSDSPLAANVLVKSDTNSGNLANIFAEAY